MRGLAIALGATLIAACSLGALDGFSGEPGPPDASADSAATESSTTNDAPATSAYHAAVAADGPVAHFALEDASGGGCASRIATSIICTYSADDIVRAQPGIGGTKAIRMSRSTAALNLSGMPSDLGAPYTVELWVQLDAGAPTGIGAYMQVAADGKNGFNLFVWNVENRVRTELWKANELIAYGAGPPAVSAAVWHHFVITHAVGPPHADLFYVDGALVESSNTKPLAGRPMVNSVFKLSGFVGYIDEIAIYDKALPAVRIAAHYTAQ